MRSRTTRWSDHPPRGVHLSDAAAVPMTVPATVPVTVLVTVPVSVPMAVPTTVPTTGQDCLRSATESDDLYRCRYRYMGRCRLHDEPLPRWRGRTSRQDWRR